MDRTNSLSRRRFLQVVGGTAAAVRLGRSLAFPPYAEAAVEAPASGAALTILAYNENPFGLFPAAREAILAAAENGNRYPKQTADALRDEVARLLGVQAEMVVLGSGSIEPLKIVTELFSTPEHGPVVAEPTFEAVVSYAGLGKINAVKVPLDAAHRLDLDHMLAAGKGAGLIYVCNPNNPTGAIVDKDALRAFLDRVPGDVPVLVDEAYHEWVDDPRYESCVRYVKEGRNVVVLRTFSKVYALAGLRVGYAVASVATAQRLEPHKLANTLNTAGIAAARASLADQAHVNELRARNARIRTDFVGWLEKHDRRSIPSDANFMMIDLGRPVPPVIDALKQRGFLVGRLFPSMPNHLRVSLGTEEQMERFKPVLAELLRS
jgi:histidinol-phosphate aminotransferase